MNQNSQDLNICELLKTRTPDRMKNFKVDKGAQTLILKSPSDWGTVLNNGRRGSLFAPDVIENLIQKMAGHSNENYSFSSKKVTTLTDEINNFSAAQIAQAKLIQNHLHDNPLAKFIIHIGGGHDHFYPFAMALIQTLKKKKILIINIDPHLDTRTDSWPNSGTPFRNLDNHLETLMPKHQDLSVTLIQLGTHLFANGEGNYQKLKNVEQEIHSMKDIRQFSNLKDFAAKKIEHHLALCDEVVLSFDIDALHSHEMPAVSAPNHHGFSMEEIHSFAQYLNTYQDKFHYLGLYEYNPLFDDLASAGGRKIAAFIYEHFLTKNS